MSREVQTLYVAEDEHDIRLDRWFKRRWPHLTHIQVEKMARKGEIRVDGSRVKPQDRLTAGAAVRVPPLPEANPRKPGDLHELTERDVAYAKSLVLYEDDMVIALNKPHGLAVQGGTKTTKHVDRLLSAWGEGMDRPRLVHRLDRDTSGVLLLGKGPEAAKRLAGAFARRQAKKTYWAIVIGNPKPSAGQIDMALKKTGINDFEMMRPADPKDPKGEPAETAFATISRAAHRAAWMALRPFTGRTHQLRAHMAAIGHPILGDPKYGDDKSRELSGVLKLQLHARRIELDHPRGGKLIVEAPLSPEMKAGFAHFGFSEDESDVDPFEGVKRQR
ncbi:MULTISPECIES: RluA family pseudouridine synthase [unclassified Brevundimonas]|uniref:RluA family pseudouridine synthase n=1 Tax=unclassified Brevundimonas TaxID=2622653 RepID=UPI000CFA8378|nr:MULTISPECIES: RluA family pseudouridine synthase [unclassified Brevundimonas]PRA26164.1 RNA pseudouridine synthase [Brevundimonas sp. MYb27]PQZ81722.1 RNA pseudouridine synthase [Brevundimonas sp. MYb31]PRB17517.1 RNA pseudouridine synthase [Brevundimonas sp. MYb52]PRB37890.1 RNA pseudouridine synthase [Brevundimonas sp. MYb46]PRB45776.1 RNA pseudouridine synthase [Brevundimonas sp. MYb33]